jgi:hypothetical protein
MTPSRLSKGTSAWGGNEMARDLDVRRTWTELGAQARLAQIESERALILKEFPALRGKLRPEPLSPSSHSSRPPRKFSAAARRRMSEGMRKFWAKRKAAAKASRGTGKT